MTLAGRISRAGAPRQPAQASQQAAGAQRQPANKSAILAQQATVGNQAVQRLLAGHRSARPVPIQRAVGFELEVPSWHVQHPDGSRLPKGTEAAITDSEGKYVVSADDDGDRSDIEFVTEAFPSKKESDPALARMVNLANDMVQTGKLNSAIKGDALIPAQEFAAHGTPNDKALFDPGRGGAMSGHIQVTIGIPLDRIGAAFGQLASGAAGDLAAVPAKKTLDKLGKAPQLPALGGAQGPSGELQGFLTLVVDYIVQGFVPMQYRRGARSEFPKSEFHLLAKTRFDKMLSMVPEYEQLINDKGQLKDTWIDWIIQAALGPLQGEKLTEARQDRVLNKTFGEKDEKPYQIDVSRENWLKAMPQDDLLAEKQDPHLQGMGAFGKGADVLVPPAQTNELAAKMAKDVTNVQKAEAQRQAKPDSNQAKPASGPAKEAPIFELRRVEIEGGAPSTWPANADKMWKLHDQILGEAQYAKPSKNKDKDDQKKQ